MGYIARGSFTTCANRKIKMRYIRVENEVIEQLLERIVFGYDGLIRNVTIKNLNSVEIVVSVQDMDVGNWTNLRFILDGLKEFKISQKFNQNDIVLSPGGIKIKEILNLYFIDLQSSFKEIEDMNCISDFRESDIYFCGKSLTWNFEPYSE